MSAKGEQVSLITSLIARAAEHYSRIHSDEALIAKVSQVADEMVSLFEKEGKVLLCGNGGSAADAQHIAAELSGRFYLDRPALFAEALHVNTSYLTAVANDYHFDEVYARAVQAKGKKGDILIALSTSGNSPNVLKAMQVAQEQEMLVVALTGKGGGKAAAHCDILLNVPDTDTPRIQEGHILLGHILCQIVEERLFPK